MKKILSLLLLWLVPVVCWAEPKIIFPGDDNTLMIMTPALNNAVNDQGDIYPLHNGESPPPGYRMVTVEDIAKSDVPAGKPYKIIDSADLPTDRGDRDAWEYGPDGQIVIDAKKLKAIELQHLPETLSAIFKALPVEQQAQFGTLAASVLMFLQQGNIEAAKLVIQGAQIPAELEPLRAQMLEKF